MATGHHNLCDYAEDERALFRLWDDDLKKTMRKRQVCETIGFCLLAAAMFGFENGKTALVLAALYFAAVLLYAAIKYTVDESNVNYLMHQWDLRDAIDRLRAEARRS
jgi:hypothetical protein